MEAVRSGEGEGEEPERVGEGEGEEPERAREGEGAGAVRVWGVEGEEHGRTEEGGRVSVEEEEAGTNVLQSVLHKQPMVGGV